jgi:hypothetical protein
MPKLFTPPVLAERIVDEQCFTDAEQSVAVLHVKGSSNAL